MKYSTILALVVLLALVYAEKNGTKCNVKGTWKAFANVKTNSANDQLGNSKYKVTLEYNGDGSISQTLQESEGDCKCKLSVTAFHWEYLARRNFSTTLNITKGSTVKCSDSLGSCTMDKCKDTHISYKDFNCTYIKQVNNFTQNIPSQIPVIVTYHSDCDEADIPMIVVSGPLGFTIAGTAPCNRQNWYTSTTAYVIYAIIIVIVLIVIVAVVALAAIALLKKKRTVGYEEA